MPSSSSKQGGVVPDGVTQAWFTTRDDKMAIRNQGNQIYGFTADIFGLHGCMSR